jgi:hypothetical protein
MVRIYIRSKIPGGCQRAQFDLPIHNGDSLLVGDAILSKIFENLGPVTIESRAHVPEENLLVIYCTGSTFLQEFLVEKYPNIEGMPYSAQLPPQDWTPL